jgi:hypothetical protein
VSVSPVLRVVQTRTVDAGHSFVDKTDMVDSGSSQLSVFPSCKHAPSMPGIPSSTRRTWSTVLHRVFGSSVLEVINVSRCIHAINFVLYTVET